MELTGPSSSAALMSSCGPASEGTFHGRAVGSIPELSNGRSAKMTKKKKGDTQKGLQSFFNGFNEQSEMRKGEKKSKACVLIEVINLQLESSTAFYCNAFFPLASVRRRGAFFFNKSSFSINSSATLEIKERKKKMRHHPLLFIISCLSVKSWNARVRSSDSPTVHYMKHRKQRKERLRERPCPE